MYSFEEIAVAVDEAHKRNRQIAAHVRGNDGVKLCVEAGVDVIEHATYADDEAVELIAERKDDALRRARASATTGASSSKGVACGIPPDVMAATEYQEEWERRLRGDEEAARRPASASSRAATTASSGARTASTPRTSSSSSPTWASRRWRRSSRRRSTAPSCCAWSTETGTIEEGKFADIARRRRRPARGHRDPAGSLEARHGDEGRQGDGEHARPAAGAAPLPDFTMDIEHIQRAKAAAPTDADGGRGSALTKSVLNLNGRRRAPARRLPRP